MFTVYRPKKVSHFLRKKGPLLSAVYLFTFRNWKSSLKIFEIWLESTVYMFTVYWLKKVSHFLRKIVCCFTFFQIQLRTMVGKTIWAVILCFPSWKMGGRKQGYPSRPRRGRDGVYPCLRPPIFQREKTKLCEFGFFQPFFATWLVKMWNIILFLTFSTFCPYLVYIFVQNWQFYTHVVLFLTPAVGNPCRWC